MTIVSTLFRVICFPHEVRIVTVDQLSFLYPNMAPSQPSSLNGPFVPMVSSPPQINNVETCSIPTSASNQFSDVVRHVLVALEPNFSFMTSYELWSGSSRIVPCLVSTSLKNETKKHEDSYFTVSTSFKNETTLTSIIPCLLSSSLKNETRNLMY